VYIFETIFIIIYLFLFFLYSNLGIFFRYAIFRTPYLEITLDRLPPFFMDWEMFKNCGQVNEDVKIIIETKTNFIDVFYLSENFLKQKIPELKVKKNNMAPLISNYTSYPFLNRFFKSRLNKIYDYNLKYITIYKIYTNNKKIISSKLVYQHTYGS
jgi:hypothetical protein